MKSQKIIQLIPILVSYAFILLFVYAAVSKIVDFQNFQSQLGQSPLLSAYAETISYSVLGFEILIAIFVAIQRTRFIALYAAFSLMVMFSAYIAIMLAYSSNLPCSCGGILDKMGWEEHLIFNVLFSLIAALAVLFTPASRSKLEL